MIDKLENRGRMSLHQNMHSHRIQESYYYRGSEAIAEISDTDSVEYANNIRMLIEFYGIEKWEDFSYAIWQASGHGCLNILQAIVESLNSKTEYNAKFILAKYEGLLSAIDNHHCQVSEYLIQSLENKDNIFSNQGYFSQEQQFVLFERIIIEQSNIGWKSFCSYEGRDDFLKTFLQTRHKINDISSNDIQHIRHLLNNYITSFEHNRDDKKIGIL